MFVQGGLLPDVELPDRQDRQAYLNEFTLVEEEISCDHPIIGMFRGSYDSAQMFELYLPASPGR